MKSMEELRSNRPYEVRADAAFSYEPIDVYSREKHAHKKQLVTAGLMDSVKGAIMEAEGSLPYFAEVYEISANINDYVLVPTIIMPSDLPNRNLVAFPREELLRANPEMGTLGYQTWRMKHTCKDHINKRIPQDSKGIVLSTFLREMKGTRGNLLKVVALCAYDRKRDPILANSILTGERTTYSMGAFCGHYTCSICNARFPEHACEHIEIPSPKMKRRLELRAEADGRLAYLKARDFVGFEISSVESPAYVSARTEKEHLIKMFS